MQPLDWVNLITSVAGFVTALAALLAIAEMKRQRRSGYKPDLILRPAVFTIANARPPFQQSFVTNHSGSSQDSVIERSFRFQLYNAGLGPAKYIDVDWRFEIDELIRRTNALAPDTVAADTGSQSFLTLQFRGSQPAAVTHNVEAQKHTDIDVMPAQAENQLDLPFVYGDLIAAYVRGLSSSLAKGLDATAFVLPMLEATIRYTDLEGGLHTKVFNLTPSLGSVRGPTAQGGQPPDELGHGTIEVREA